jgi:steroid delta-isomerase-like uncharacterized protein
MMTETHTTSLAQLRPPVRQWIEGFNAHDVEALLALYTPDAILFDAGMKHPRRGTHEIAQWFRTRFRTIPTITYTLTGHIFMEEQQAAVTWTTHGQGPRLLGQAWLARPFSVDGVSVFSLRDGLIAQQRGYYDHLAAIQQLFPPLKWLPVRL